MRIQFFGFLFWTFLGGSATQFILYKVLWDNMASRMGPVLKKSYTFPDFHEKITILRKYFLATGDTLWYF